MVDCQLILLSTGLYRLSAVSFWREYLATVWSALQYLQTSTDWNCFFTLYYNFRNWEHFLKIGFVTKSLVFFCLPGNMLALMIQINSLPIQFSFFCPTFLIINYSFSPTNCLKVQTKPTLKTFNLKQSTEFNWHRFTGYNHSLGSRHSALYQNYSL